MIEATFLEDGDTLNVAVQHADSSITLIGIGRTGDTAIINVDYAEGHVPDVKSYPRQLVWGGAGTPS
jgi:hypothetical protein